VNAAERILALIEPELRPTQSPTRAGYLDLLGGSDPESTGIAQRMMLSVAVPRIYERWWRPALGRVAKGMLGPGTKDEQRIARLLLSLTPGDGALDVACGPGNFTRAYARTIGEDGIAVGIDVSRTMLERAVHDTPAKQYANVAFARCDAVTLPFRDQSFDAVSCVAALHLFAEPFVALDHMTRVLTPGGRIAILTSCRTRSAVMRTWDGRIGQLSGIRMFDQDDIVGALYDRGFRDVSQRISGLTQFVGARLA
jgi:ubiquinone/menaquinone biosynthesis C-methylase UbiE